MAKKSVTATISFKRRKDLSAAVKFSKQKGFHSFSDFARSTIAKTVAAK